MTGEMHHSEVTKDAWPLHFAIAKALKGTVHPFDQYQGPYVLTAGGKFWVTSDDGHLAQVYNEHADKVSAPFSPWHRSNAVNCRRAVQAARQVLA